MAYPGDHRREYGELMVQLFRDRMRRDGKGIRGVVVWIQMLNDLIGSAFRERIEGVIMTKRKWFAVGLAVLLAVAVAGVGTIYAKYGDQEELTVTVMTGSDTKTVSGTGSEDFAETVQRAVAEGAIDQAGADKVLASLLGGGTGEVWRYDGEAVGLAEALEQAVGGGVISQALADEVVRSIKEKGVGAEASIDAVFAWNDARSYTGTGPEGVANAMREAAEAEARVREVEERIDKMMESFGEAESSRMWRYEGGPGGLAEAVRQAVEEGELSEGLAEMILESFRNNRGEG